MTNEYKIHIIELLNYIDEEDKEFLINIYTLIYIHLYGKEN